MSLEGKNFVRKAAKGSRIPHQSLRDDTGDLFESVAAWNDAQFSLSADDRERGSIIG